MALQIPAPDGYQEIRDALRGLCGTFDSRYWQQVDAERGYPEAFVDALTKAGWMAALIPSEFGGSGLGLAEASVIMEEINFSGGNSGALHGQMYNMNTLLRHGSPEQKRRYLPGIAAGQLRLQSMAVTEPGTGTDTTQLKTTAVRTGDRYIIRGQKVWISRIQHSDLMILLARTTPADQVRRRSDGMSIFLVDLHQAIGRGMTVRPIMNMVNHETNEVFFDELEVPAENRIGATSSTGSMRSARSLPRNASATPTGSSTAPGPTAASGWSSAGRSDRTRASSSPLPRPTSRPRPPT
jgi:acyl-CoA dehydrogenase